MEAWPQASTRTPPPPLQLAQFADVAALVGPPEGEESGRPYSARRWRVVDIEAFVEQRMAVCSGRENTVILFRG